ncbi:hypothetical protein [uncultured Akkermansia sp.]|uniref:hypothetical protein n=1 Tax=uncultured Akkermansia sp. TaxID=512294 RepID=UPI00265CA85E|nr:hypothetical protein [uncultured Akkermansia sp.]
MKQVYTQVYIFIFSKCTSLKNTISIAGLIKRKNSWVALFNIAGKQIRKTTKIAVIPTVIPLGKSKMTGMRENEDKACLIAEELEKPANGERMEAEKVKALAGERAGRNLFMGSSIYKGHGMNIR